MFRRYMSIISMLAFLAGQLASVSHAHAVIGESSGHDDRPHVHVACVVHSDHCHEDEHSHQHTVCGDLSHTPACDPQTEQEKHDRDAVHLPNVLGDSLHAKTVVALGQLQVHLALVVAVVPVSTYGAESSGEAFFPSECSDTCPLYLALRALRI